MDFPIRRLGPADAPTYRAVRLRMLEELPEAFGTSHAEAAARPVEAFAKDLAGKRAFFGAFDGDDLVGTVNFNREAAANMAHRGWLSGMYVAPKARGSGCALDLIETLIAHARNEVIQVHLGVGTFNHRARQLYEKAGFSIYATEPRALLVNGAFFDEHFMVRFLDKDKDND